MRLLFLLAGLFASQAALWADTDFKLRASGFGLFGLLPSEDLARRQLGAHYSDESIDVRSMF